MRENYFKDKLNRTVLTEKEEQKTNEDVKPVEKSFSKNFFSASTFNTPTEMEKTQIFSNENIFKTQMPKFDKSSPRINMFSAASFENMKENAENDYLPCSSKEVKENTKEFAVNATTVTNEEKKSDFDFVEFKAKPKAHAKAKMFRLRVVTAIYFIVIAICTGWLITNSVRIGQINNSISEMQNIYDDNIIKLASKVDSLKILKENPEGSTLDPIEDVITLHPRPLEEPTSYQPQSNWFDSLCNWFAKLFGG